MSRSGYNVEMIVDVILWRGAVASAIRGRRGQAFLKEMLKALDQMKTKRLIHDKLISISKGDVCAIGAVGVARGMDIQSIESEDSEAVAEAFGIAPALVCEISYYNDEVGSTLETPAQRWTRMRAWVQSQIN
ncbi:MAG: hypothetical protein ACREA9_21775 [Pyrinomonadaceae bacterium]